MDNLPEVNESQGSQSAAANVAFAGPVLSHEQLNHDVWREFMDELVLIVDATNGICEICGEDAQVTTLVPYHECYECATDWPRMGYGSVPFAYGHGHRASQTNEEPVNEAFYSISSLTPA